MTIPVITKLEALPETTVVEGENLSIKCVAEGMPQPVYVWSKIPNEVSNDNLIQRR